MTWTNQLPAYTPWNRNGGATTAWTIEHPPYTPWHIAIPGVTIRITQDGTTVRVTENDNIRVLEFIAPVPTWSIEHSTYTPWTTE